MSLLSTVDIILIIWQGIELETNKTVCFTQNARKCVLIDPQNNCDSKGSLLTTIYMTAD